MRKIIVTQLLLVISFASCKKDGTSPRYNSEPVITAYIAPGDTFSIQLTHQTPMKGETITAPSLNNLSIVVVTNDSSYILTDMGNGKYANPHIPITANQEYNMSFMYNGLKISGYTKIPTDPTGFSSSRTEIAIEQITSATTEPPMNFGSSYEFDLTWDNDNSEYYIVVIENLESTKIKIIDTAIGDTARVFRTDPLTSNEYKLRGMSFKYFGRHRVLLYHINADYASLYSNNTNNSQNLYTPSTGITNGVGIFTGVNADTLYLTVNKD